MANFEEKAPKDLALTKQYYGNEGKYPKYENYDSINVDKIIGAPITFCVHFDKSSHLLINDKIKFKQIIIKR